jgi:hypothetical protein
MPTIAGARFPRPKSWQELEDIVFDVFTRLWNNPYTSKHGRPGQRQNGVDIYGYNQKNKFEGVQVKGRCELFGKSVSEKELREEVGRAKTFEPQLNHFTIVTSANRDAYIQKFAREISREHKNSGLFTVNVWGWEDIEERLAQFDELAQRHYSQFFHKDEAARPKFDCQLTATSRLDTNFTPYFKIKQYDGDAIPQVRWRFRGPHFEMNWRQGHLNPNTTASATFNMLNPLAGDKLVKETEIGLEIAFYWHGRWSSELHTWPITRKELPHKVVWNISSDELLPPKYFDDIEK